QKLDQSRNLTSLTFTTSLVQKLDTQKKLTKETNSAVRKNPSPRSVTPKEADPRVHTLIAAFVRKYTEVVGSAPRITGADAKSFKDLLRDRDVPAIEAVMDRYFSDPFYRDIGFDGPGFARAFNRLNSAGVKKPHNYDEGMFPAV